MQSFWGESHKWSVRLSDPLFWEPDQHPFKTTYQLSVDKIRLFGTFFGWNCFCWYIAHCKQIKCSNILTLKIAFLGSNIRILWNQKQYIWRWKLFGSDFLWMQPFGRWVTGVAQQVFRASARFKLEIRFQYFSTVYPSPTQYWRLKNLRRFILHNSSQLLQYPLSVYQNQIKPITFMAYGWHQLFSFPHLIIIS